MPSFPKPTFAHAVNLSKEIKALRTYRNSDPALKIPKATSKTLRVAPGILQTLVSRTGKILI